MKQDNSISLEQAVDRNPLTVTPEMSLAEVIKLMSQDWVNSCFLTAAAEVREENLIPAIDDGCVLAIANSQILGIFTEGDLLRIVATGRSLQGMKIGEVMNRNFVTLTATGDRDIFTALELLHRHQIRHLPILDTENRLIGLVTHNSLRSALQSSDLIKFRLVREAMSTKIVHAPPTASVLEVVRLMVSHGVKCVPIAEGTELSTTSILRPLGIITEKDIVQFQLLELNLEQLSAQTVMSAPLFSAKPEDSLASAHQQMQKHRVRQLVVVGTRGGLVGIITHNSLLEMLDPKDIRKAWELLQHQVYQLEAAKLESLQRRNVYLERQLQQQAAELQVRSQQEQLVAAIALRIRQSLDLTSVLDRTVTEVRQLIEADRVLIYRLEPDGSGIVTTEAVSNPQWSILHRVIKDCCFEQGWLHPYQQGHVRATTDIYQSSLSQCHIEFLEQFQVRANIAIPILLTGDRSSTDQNNSVSPTTAKQPERLWGLLIVHQCSSPRNWQNSEIEMLQLLATQVAIAIQQAELYQQMQTELKRRKQAEISLQKSEISLKTALDAADLGTWIWEIATDEVIFCSRSESIFGFAPGEFPGTLEAALERIHPEDREAINQQVNKAIESGGLYEIENRIVLPDGKVRWIAARGHILCDSNGQPLRMTGVIADITEKKQLEAKYLRNQRLESLGSLAGGVAHDLNNILTPIMMSVQLLPVTLGEIDERSQQLLEMLDSNVKRGSALVKQVLSFARGIESDRSVVQVKHLITDIKQMAVETFPKSIEIKTDVSQDLWTVKGDANQIHQILLNLVVNARDAMPDGGILNISGENITIDAESVGIHPDARVGMYVAIAVSDTGTGIPPEIQEQIFEPFFTTKEGDEGTGLGLATVMTIVKNHGGFINLVSREGQGSQFNVFLPAIDTAETTTQERLELPRGSGELILVVDDEATIREITRASLETHDYRVITANDGIEGIASYVQNQAEIALVLMNMMMPSMDGTTAIRTIQKIDPEVKIVAVSGRNFSPQTFSDRQINIRAFLAKPYTTEALLRTIGDVVHM